MWEWATHSGAEQEVQLRAMECLMLNAQCPEDGHEIGEGFGAKAI